MTIVKTVSLHQEAFENSVARLLVALAALLGPVTKEQPKKTGRAKQAKRASN